jgi:xylulokinase
MNMALLGVDIGTSGTRAVLFGEAEEIITSSYQEYPIFYPQPGWGELDAEIIWTAFRKTVREVAHKHRTQIKAMSLSCMSNNIVPVRRDGSAIRNGILAFDNRATEEAQIILDTIGELPYFKIRGGRPRPVSGLSKILWLKKNEPETFHQTWKFMTFADLIRTRLGFPAVIDYATAASSLPYDIRKMDYSDTLLKEFGLKREMFSEPVPADAVLGEIGLEVRTELNLSKGVKIVTGGYDTHCGILGAGITRTTPQTMADIAGTFERVAGVKTKPILTKQALENDINSCCNIIEDSYIISTALAASGSIVRWFRDELASEAISSAREDGTNVYDRMFEPLNFEGGTIMAIPYFAGSAGDAQAKGAFLGLTLGTSRQEILQGIVEGVTHEMTELVDRLERLNNTPIDVIRSFGGPGKSSKWLQLKADISGKQVESLQIEEASALGAAMLAGVATGAYDSYEEAVKTTVKIKKTYRPRPEISRVYQRQHKIYQQLIESLRPVNRELNNMR